MSLRDVHAQVQDWLGIKIVVSTAKAHSKRGRVGEELYTVFGVKSDILDKCKWTESVNQARGLRHPRSIQTWMLEFNPRTVETKTFAKFCSMMGRSQRFAILEWGLVKPEKISDFLQRMKVDQRFRTYYYGLYDFLRLL